MAIVQTGSALRFLPGSANSGTVSSTITVPADAEFVIVGWTGFSSTANFFSTGSMTFTKGGVDTTMTAVSGADSNTGLWQAAMFYLALPDTGANKTLKWDWAGTGAASDGSAICSVTFWKGMDTSSSVRGTGGAQASGVPYTTGTITAASGDLIVAWVGAFTSAVEGSVDSWSNLSLLTQVTFSSSADGAWATGSPTGNTTVAASTATNLADGGILAISLKPAAATAAPQGWQGPLGKAAAAIIAPALLAGGLIWCPQPIAAAPAPNTVTIDKWQQPLSKPVAVARAIQSGGDPPFNTFQTNTVRIDKWLVPLSVAVPVAKVVQSGGDPPFNTRQTNTATIDKWQVPLGIAVPVAKAQLGNHFVPFDTFQTNTTTIDKWQQPLSIAVPVAQAKPGNSFVPFNTFQINTVRIDKWLVPLSVAIPVAKTVPTWSFVPLNTAQVVASYTNFYLPPLSIAVPVAQAQPGYSFVPFDTFQINTTTIDKWQQPLSVVPSTFKAQLGNSFVPFDTAQTNTSTIDKWQVALSVAAPVARATPGFSFTPFDTAQTNTVRIDKWQSPLSTAAPIVKAQVGNSFVPLNTAQTNTATVEKWQQPLSVAVAVAKATQGNSFVPFDTAQIVAGVYTNLYLQPLSVAAPVATAQQGVSVVPFNTFQTNTASVDKWQSPLGVAVAVAKPIHIPLSWVPAPFAQYPLGWFGPLSQAVAVAAAQQGNSFVPFDTVQTTPAGIAGMAWWMPLGTVPLSVVYAPQQFALAQLQFGEIAPSPEPVVVGTVGGTRKRHHVPGGRHFSRKEWEELQREIAAERTALLAEQKLARDEKARLKVEAQQARVAKILAKADAVDRQRAEVLAATAEQTAKAEAEFLAAMLAEIANQEDEDEVMMLLLGL